MARIVRKNTRRAQATAPISHKHLHTLETLRTLESLTTTTTIPHAPDAQLNGHNNATPSRYVQQSDQANHSAHVKSAYSAFQSPSSSESHSQSSTPSATSPIESHHPVTAGPTSAPAPAPAPEPPTPSAPATTSNTTAAPSTTSPPTQLRRGRRPKNPSLRARLAAVTAANGKHKTYVPLSVRTNPEGVSAPDPAPTTTTTTPTPLTATMDVDEPETAPAATPVKVNEPRPAPKASVDLQRCLISSDRWDSSESEPAPAATRVKVNKPKPAPKESVDLQRCFISSDRWESSESEPAPAATRVKVNKPKPAPKTSIDIQRCLVSSDRWESSESLDSSDVSDTPASWDSDPESQPDPQAPSVDDHGMADIAAPEPETQPARSKASLPPVPGNTRPAVNSPESDSGDDTDFSSGSGWDPDDSDFTDSDDDDHSGSDSDSATVDTRAPFHQSASRAARSLTYQPPETPMTDHPLAISTALSATDSTRRSRRVAERPGPHRSASPSTPVTALSGFTSINNPLSSQGRGSAQTPTAAPLDRREFDSQAVKLACRLAERKNQTDLVMTMTQIGLNPSQNADLGDIMTTIRHMRPLSAEQTRIVAGLIKQCRRELRRRTAATAAAAASVRKATARKRHSMPASRSKSAKATPVQTRSAPGSATRSRTTQPQTPVPDSQPVSLPEPEPKSKEEDPEPVQPAEPSVRPKRTRKAANSASGTPTVAPVRPPAPSARAGKTIFINSSVASQRDNQPAAITTTTISTATIPTPTAPTPTIPMATPTPAPPPPPPPTAATATFPATAATPTPAVRRSARRQSALQETSANIVKPGPPPAPVNKRLRLTATRRSTAAAAAATATAAAAAAVAEPVPIEDRPIPTTEAPRTRASRRRKESLAPAASALPATVPAPVPTPTGTESTPEETAEANQADADLDTFLQPSPAKKSRRGRDREHKRLTPPPPRKETTRSRRVTSARSRLRPDPEPEQTPADSELQKRKDELAATGFPGYVVKDSAVRPVLGSSSDEAVTFPVDIADDNSAADKDVTVPVPQAEDDLARLPPHARGTKRLADASLPPSSGPPSPIATSKRQKTMDGYFQPSQPAGEQDAPRDPTKKRPARVVITKPSTSQTVEKAAPLDTCLICDFQEPNLLTCSWCSNSYHLECVEIPVKESDLGESWVCIDCQGGAGSAPSSVPPTNIFSTLLEELKGERTRLYELPDQISSYFVGVSRRENGVYHDTTQAIPIRNRSGYNIQTTDHLKLKDSRNQTIHCVHCSKTSLTGRPIIACDDCGANWHLDCVDPPMANVPADFSNGKFRYRWVCPRHVQHDLALINNDFGLRERRFHRIRRPARPQYVDTTLRPGLAPVGANIEFLDNESEEFYSEHEEDHEGKVTVYRMPTRGVKLDFISQFKRDPSLLLSKTALANLRKSRWAAAKAKIDVLQLPGVLAGGVPLLKRVSTKLSGRGRDQPNGVSGMTNPLDLLVRAALGDGKDTDVPDDEDVTMDDVIGAGPGDEAGDVNPISTPTPTPQEEEEDEDRAEKGPAVAVMFSPPSPPGSEPKSAGRGVVGGGEVVTASMSLSAADMAALEELRNAIDVLIERGRAGLVVPT